MSGDLPECETCGKATCPDAGLAAFSEPQDCVYAPIYRALRDAKDCDYGCARDYTNQAVRLWVVEAVEQIVTEALAAQRQGIAEAIRNTAPSPGDAYNREVLAHRREGLLSAARIAEGWGQ